MVTPTCAVQPEVLAAAELDGLRREARGLRDDARYTDRPRWTVEDGQQFVAGRGFTGCTFDSGRPCGGRV